MKNSRRLFILIEAVWAIMVVVLAVAMFLGRNGKEPDKISVILQNSDDARWSAFKYGLRMAAEDKKVEIFVVNTGGVLSLEDEQLLMEQEIDGGADGIIVEPVPGDGAAQMFKKIQKQVPVMLVESISAGEDGTSSPAAAEPDHYAMGRTLAQELRKDYNENLEGKTLGILLNNGDSQASAKRERGFLDALEGAGAQILWSFAGVPQDTGEKSLAAHDGVDFVVALDNESLTAAGKAAAAQNLHGALVYGIGNSTEAVYYLDTGKVECLVVPDDFNQGYQGLVEVTEELTHYFYKMQNRTVPHTVFRRDTLFSKKNQEILFTMSQ